MKFLRFLAYLLIGAVPAYAQPVGAGTPAPTPAPLQMSLDSPMAVTETPLSIATRFGYWFPVQVTLTNTGDPVSGEVRLSLTSSSDFHYAPNEFYAPVDLPSNSHKVVWLYGRMERDDATGISVTFSGRGVRATTATASLAPVDPSQRLFLFADDSGNRPGYLSDYSSRDLYRQPLTDGINAGFPPIRPLAFKHDLIPDRWIGFDAVDLVALDDISHGSLMPAQIAALKDYAYAGGTLVVPSGANWQQLAASPLKELWPEQLTASGPASSAQVDELVDRYRPGAVRGGDRLGGAPVVLAAGRLKPDAALMEGDPSAPFMAHWATGAGTCILLNFDFNQPPFLGWTGLEGVWREIMGAAAHPTRLESLDPNSAYGLTAGFDSGSGFTGGGTPFYGGSAPSQAAATPTNTLLGSMSHAKQLRMPPVSSIAWFLAVYVLCLVPLNYFVLQSVDRRELAWITIPVIVLIFSVLAYQSALYLRGRAILTRQVDIVQSAAGSPEARVDTLFWLFSPAKTTYDVASTSGSSAICEYIDSTKQRAPDSFSVKEPAEGGSFLDEAVAMGQWTDRPFSAEATVDLGQGLRLTGGKDPALVNGTSFDLKQVLLIMDGRVIKFGDIPAGASAPAQGDDGMTGQDSDMVGRIQNAAHLSGIFDSTTLTNNIPATALATALGPEFGKFNRGGVVVAFGDQAAAPVAFPGQPAGRAVTVFLFSLPSEVNLPVAKSAKRAPRQATVKSASFETIPDPATSGDETQMATFDAKYDCTLESSVQISNIAVVARGTGVLAIVKGRVPILAKVRNPANGAWQPLDGHFTWASTPASSWTFRCQIPVNFVRTPSSEIALDIKAYGVSARVDSVQVTSS